MRITGPGLFVSGAWLVLTSAAFFYAIHFGSPEPFGDEWDLVPGVTYSEPYLPWLWAQHNEHRLPLPKLVYTWLLQASRFDARSGAVATISVLSGLALAFMLAARRVRGGFDYADAFFPIAFLNWGHFENYLIGFQISFALSMGLACVWLLAALRWCEEAGTGPIKVMAVCVVLLPLCGAHGLVYAPPLGIATVWLVRGTGRGARWACATAAIVAGVLCLLYFRGYVKPNQHPPSAGVRESLTIAGEVLALGWGWVGQMTWPFSGTLIVGFIALTLGLLVNELVKGLRDAAIAIAAVGGGAFVLALGIGWGRSGFGPLAGFAVRYGMIMLPLMAAGYLAWQRFGGPVGSSLVPMGLFTISCLFLTQHFRTGIAEGRQYAEQMRAFTTDLRNGKSADELARRHPKLYPHAEPFAARIRILEKCGVDRYARPVKLVTR